MAILSLHTSPLAQPGSGDGGGMNVYVRELSSALTRAGIACDVFTRAWKPDLDHVVNVEPGFRVVHVPAGPPEPLGREDQYRAVDEFTAGVRAHLRESRTEAIHANYWLSGVAGHTLKHEFDLPLVSTFHTLARVKAEAEIGADEPAVRVQAESDVVRCSDAITASCADEAAQLVRLYGDIPGRIELVPPGVEHAFFSPGSRTGARSALDLPDDHRVLLFVGRIQPLKGVDVAVRTLADLEDGHATLLVVGGPSGPDGEGELLRLRALVRELDLDAQVRFIPPQPHHLLSTYYRAANVCLVPSRTESFGLVALEAAACGTPVVAAAVGGLRTLVDHGRTGFLVEGRDPGAFAAYTSEILNNVVLADQMGRAAAARARRYTWSTAAARLRRLYTDLTARQLVECR